MRVLVVIPPIAKTVYGGAAIQARCTADAMQKLGAHVEVATTDKPNARGFDIAHIFGISDAHVLSLQIKSCHEVATPVAVSPIWCSWREVSARALRAVDVLRRQRSESRAEEELAELRRRSVRRLLSRRDLREFDVTEAAQGKLLQAVQLLLPVSAAEARDYRARLGARAVPFAIVPNGIRYDLVPPWQSRRSGVVCAARIEPGKNQHMLAFALRNLDVELTFAGDVGDEKFFAVVEKWAGPKTQFVGRLEPSALLQLFARSAVHAMPSWADVASLAHLEAAACGARVVVGDRGFEWEYLEGDAEYADPGDPTSIRNAVVRALGKGRRVPGDALDERLRELTWRRAAEQTLRAYRLAIGKVRAA